MHYLIMIGALTGCSRTIYLYQGQEGAAKFILYKHSYEYLEKSPWGRYRTCSTYEIKDTIIQFAYKNNERTPYFYYNDEVEIRGQRADRKSQTLHLTSKEAKGTPLLFGSVVLRDQEGKVMEKIQSDFDGAATINDDNEIEYIEVTYPGCIKQLFKYEKYKDYDIEVKLEEFKRGGRLSEGCILVYKDILLEYGIDNPSDITQLERNGIVFKRKK